jgi:hypothetical protein
MSGFFAIAVPTALIALGEPANLATCWYVATFPLGILDTTL